MRRLVLIVLLVPFLGPRLNKPGTIAPPPAAPPAFSLSGDVGTDTRQSSVLLLPLTAPAEEFQLTDAAHGVRFDIDGEGTREMVAWPDGRSDVALLARDTNGDGAITSGRELIGSATDPDARNGCNALLALFRRTGAEPAGAIHAGHALYDQLLLWVDRNHDGRSQPDELLKARDRFTAIGSPRSGSASSRATGPTRTATASDTRAGSTRGRLVRTRRRRRPQKKNARAAGASSR